MEGREIVVVTAAMASGGGRDGGKGEATGKGSGGGITFIDLSTGALYSQTMKNCLCPPQGITTSGGISSFSGRGGCGDYLIAAQSKKPQINIWQWGKPHALMQCHIQEITTAIATDLNGFFLCGGTRGGRIFVWELSSGSLVQSWQAHFKALTTMTFTPCGNFLISASEDGMVRAWDLVTLLNSDGRGHSDSQIKSFSPYRSWTPHTLSVTGLVLLTAGGPSSTVRVLTCSLDRSVAIYDLHSNRLLSCKSYPESLTCCAVNPSFDYAYLGSMSGAIYSLAISHAAVALSEANWKLSVAESRSQSAFPATQRSPHSISLLIGHDKPVTSLSHSHDNVTLVSGSQDGHLRIWNTISRQCVLVVDPFSLSPINNAFIILKPEVFDLSGSQEIHRPTLAPLGHLKKYKTAAHSQSSDPTETSQSSSDSRIGTRISFVSQEPRGPISFPLDAMSLPGAAQEGAASQRDSLPTSASGFVKLPGSDLSLPSKIRRQDTFGDEFYESWDRGVSVEPVDSLLQGGDENGNLSFTAVGEGGQKRYREESETEEGSEGEDSVELRNEMEKWKRLAAELQDQVVHLRATAASQSSSSSASGGGEQSLRKKSKKGLRYHNSVLAQEQESPKPQHQSPGPQGAPQGGEQGESRRQSKATPPPKPKKSPKAKS